MKTSSVSRRYFLKATSAAAAVASTESFIRAAGNSGSKKAIVGTGEHTYECIHGWGELPRNLQWGETHGVTIDAAGFIYIKHNTGPSGKRHQDAIVVFDPAGKYVRSFGDEYSAFAKLHTVGHGIDVRSEDGEEFLYLCYTWANVVTKTTLQGEIVWALSTPWESGVYQDRKEFIPTNVAFHPTDGGFYIADGYGSNYIHRYERNGKYVSTFGGKGGRDQHGKFSTPHGLWVDNRPGREPLLCICDRANARLEYFSLDGKYVSTVEGLSFPAHLDIRGEVLLCPDLHARVTLFDKENKVLAHLGFDQGWTDKVLNKGGQGGFIMRTKPETWEDGRFIHPHDACFDKDGNIFVVEWVSTGRVTKLRKLV